MPFAGSKFQVSGSKFQVGAKAFGGSGSDYMGQSNVRPFIFLLSGALIMGLVLGFFLKAKITPSPTQKMVTEIADELQRVVAVTFSLEWTVFDIEPLVSSARKRIETIAEGSGAPAGIKKQVVKTSGFFLKQISTSMRSIEGLRREGGLGWQKLKKRLQKSRGMFLGSVEKIRKLGRF